MPNDSAAVPINLDIITRISATTTDSGSDELNIQYVADSKSFLTRLYAASMENIMLRSSIVCLWDNYKYNQEYISFLLGSYDKEEFKKIAVQYAKSFETSYQKKDILFATKLFFDILKTELSTSDLSILMNVDCDTIENAMLEFEAESLIERIE